MLGLLTHRKAKRAKDSMYHSDPANLPWFSETHSWLATKLKYWCWPVFALVAHQPITVSIPYDTRRGWRNANNSPNSPTFKRFNKKFSEMFKMGNHLWFETAQSNNNPCLRGNNNNLYNNSLQEKTRRTRKAQRKKINFQNNSIKDARALTSNKTMITTWN